ncbi:hypothetical protein ACQEVS_15120 [Streptomyces sp. CA-181903]|uniref:hypothetical protein n=1 Tax=Streptomyces sp. CA-181903 TaxID=3240055 RepID=UPI003D8FAD08
MGLTLLITFMLFLPVPIVMYVHVIPWRLRRRLRASGIEVTGECVRVAWDSNSAVIAVEYDTRDGRRFCHRSDPLHLARVERGDAVRITYDPRRPVRACLSSEIDEAKEGFFGDPIVYVELLFLVPQLIWIYLLVTGAMRL